MSQWGTPDNTMDRSGFRRDVGGGGRPGGGSGGIPIKLILAMVIAGFSVFSYLMSSSTNTVTGRTQHVKLSPQQEVALGLQSAPEMIQQMGGLSRSREATGLVERVGARLVAAVQPRLDPTVPKYPFKFHCLADAKTVNAFALPGGQIFITEALLRRLETEGQLAGVLGHEMGHVFGRHSAEQMSKAELAQGLVTATGVATVDGMGATGGQLANMVASFTLMKYGRDHELESDQLGLKFMYLAGYDPRAMIRVMQILEQASGGGNRPEFSSTHPNPGNRIEHIKAALTKEFPQGVPPGLTP
jgi:beta-barrel assembly-enhancing protease